MHHRSSHDAGGGRTGGYRGFVLSLTHSFICSYLMHSGSGHNAGRGDEGGYRSDGPMPPLLCALANTLVHMQSQGYYNYITCSHRMHHRSSHDAGGGSKGCHCGNTTCPHCSLPSITHSFTCSHLMHRRRSHNAGRDDEGGYCVDTPCPHCFVLPNTLIHVFTPDAPPLQPRWWRRQQRRPLQRRPRS